MNDDVLSLQLVDFTIASRTFKEISDLWARNVPQILVEHERCTDAFNKLKEYHKKDYETIKQLKSSNEKLNDKLDKALRDKEIYATEIHTLRSDHEDLLRKLRDVSEERDAVLRKLVNCQSQLEEIKEESQKVSTDFSKTRNDLRDTTDVIASLESQLNIDRREFEQRLKEQENTARIRMEDQKSEIERRMREECNNKIRKYDVAHNKMKTDFENALSIAQQETNELALQRNEFYAKYIDLQEKIVEHKERAHAEMRKLVAEKCREMVNQLSMQKDPERRKEFLLRSPEFFASRFIKEIDSGACSPIHSYRNYENGIDDEEVEKDNENVAPRPKSRRRSVSATSYRKQPTIVQETLKRGTFAPRSNLPSTSQFQRNAHNRK